MRNSNYTVCCGGTFTNWQQGTITSLGYPSGYAAGIECVWRVLSPAEGASLAARLLDFDLRLPVNVSSSASAGGGASGLVGNCANEMLELYDSDGPAAGRLVTRFCAREAGDSATV